MKKKVLLLAVSAKHGGYCVAGIDLETNSFIRLVTEDGTGSGPIDRRYFSFEPLDIISVNISGKANAAGAQTENFYINDYNIEKIGFDNSLKTINSFLDKKHITPFGTKYASLKTEYYDELNHSMCLLKVHDMVLYNSLSINNDNKTKINFKTVMYDGKEIQHERFCVTDIKYFQKMKGRTDSISLGSGYLFISVGPKNIENDYYCKYVSCIFVDDDFQ